MGKSQIARGDQHIHKGLEEVVAQVVAGDIVRETGKSGPGPKVGRGEITTVGHNGKQMVASAEQRSWWNQRPIVWR